MEFARLYGTGKFVMYMPAVSHPKDWPAFFKKRVKDVGMRVDDVNNYDHIDCGDRDFFIIDFTAQISTTTFITSKEIRACLKGKYDCIEGGLRFKLGALGFIFVKEFVVTRMEIEHRGHSTTSKIHFVLPTHMSKKKDKMRKRATKYFLILGAYRYKDELQERE